MILSFTLSMPGCPSWNGRWSGEDKLYVVTRNLGRSKKATDKAKQIATKGFFGYSWSDGWRAAIEVREVTAGEARKLRAKSSGFCSYEWMVESILRHGAIYADHERPTTSMSSST